MPGGRTITLVQIRTPQKNVTTMKEACLEHRIGTGISRKSVQFHVKNTGFRKKNPVIQMAP